MSSKGSRNQVLEYAFGIIGLLSLVGIPVGLTIGVMFDSIFGYNVALVSFIWLIWVKILIHAYDKLTKEEKDDSDAEDMH